jgi:hypothetical protein
MSGLQIGRLDLDTFECRFATLGETPVPQGQRTLLWSDVPDLPAL